MRYQRSATIQTGLPAVSCMLECHYKWGGQDGDLLINGSGGRWSKNAMEATRAYYCERRLSNDGFSC